MTDSEWQQSGEAKLLLVHAFIYSRLSPITYGLLESKVPLAFSLLWPGEILTWSRCRYTFVEGQKPEGDDVPPLLAPAIAAHDWPRGRCLYPEQLSTRAPGSLGWACSLGASEGSQLLMVGGRDIFPGETYRGITTEGRARTRTQVGRQRESYFRIYQKNANEEFGSDNHTH